MEIKDVSLDYPGVTVREDGAIFLDGKELKPVAQGPNRMPSVLVRKAFKGGKGYVNVHRLVALAFLSDPPSNQCQVRHLDGNTWNNDKGNLEYTARYQSDKRDKIFNMLRTGYPVEEIMQKLGVQRGYVLDVFEKYKGEINEWRRANNLPQKRIMLDASGRRTLEVAQQTYNG